MKATLEQLRGVRAGAESALSEANKAYERLVALHPNVLLAGDDEALAMLDDAIVSVGRAQRSSTAWIGLLDEYIAGAEQEEGR
jgi:predicted short-subunit dehydrogenase-like oxidoreductase (DUF2520 family)